MYLAAIPLAFVHQIISDILYAAVALTWLIPDRRIETTLARAERSAVADEREPHP